MGKAIQFDIGNGTLVGITAARSELKLKAAHAADLYDRVKDSALDFGRYLANVKDSGLAAALLKASELREATEAGKLSDARSTGFSLWYKSIRLDRATVDRYMRYARTYDRLVADVPEVKDLGQDATLALATVESSKDAQKVIGKAIADDGKLTSATIRAARKVLDAETVPTPKEQADKNAANKDAADVVEPTELDAMIASILKVDLGRKDLASTIKTSTVKDVRAAGNALLAIANEMEERNK